MARRARVASLTAFLKRPTKTNRKGATATTTSVKSQSSHSISPSIPAIESTSTTKPSAVDDAKSWMVATSSVMVLSNAALGCVS